ncbi:isocitrate dehydrogenase [Methanoculleus taiwanensis]|uniref:Isocitrate dehydrogenase n=1 Tax=Methanoculleus taiwanensis TaxID=1550565 RepID=A0A498H1B2_9EURY|nr:isocitrate/isopropylmalate dehydrogenase family protein [Methanoculleus taiwanensis]RXE55810.1 isocitrate dehydrogenase [Methanoculleus taiwanensis]
MVQIAVVEGDGIGQEVIPVARAVIEAVRPDFSLYDVEVGYGRWKRTGSACDAETMESLRAADAILFGAVTTPPDPEYRSVLLQIRRDLDLYANIRPIRGDGFDLVIVRENTEGLYSGIEWREADRACTLRVITEKGSRRIARCACTLAKQRRHLTIGNKANVLKSDAFFLEICTREAEEAGVPCKAHYIDALCLDILMHPDRYDVIVTTNMFGDILSDAAAYLVGGLGLLPSANIGDKHAFFEPVHGSAPDIAGKNVANPIAAIKSAAMMLRHFGDTEHAAAVEEAVRLTVAKGTRTVDLGGATGTREFGEAVLGELGALIGP